MNRVVRGFSLRRRSRLLAALAVALIAVLGFTVQPAQALPANWGAWAKTYPLYVDEVSGRTSKITVIPSSRLGDYEVATYYWGPDYPTRVKLGGSFIGSPAVALNNTGKVHIFVIGNDNAVWVKWETKAGQPWSYSAWVSLGGTCMSNPSVFLNSVTRKMEVFCVGEDGAIWTKWQTAAGGAWSAWASLGGYTYGRVIAQNYGSSGGAQAFVIGTDDLRYVNTRVNATSGWSGWRRG